MDLIAPRKSLLSALSPVAGAAAAARTTSPMLACVRIEAAKGGLSLAATDLSVAIRASAEATVKGVGACAVPAKDLLDRIKVMPEGPVHLAWKAPTLALKSGVSTRRYSLRGAPAEEFPELRWPEEGAGARISAATLGGALGRIAHAISTDESRPHINGALIRWRDGVLKVVGTDGHQLAEASYALDSAAAIEMLLPLRAARELIALCAAAPADAEAVVSMKGSDAFFALGAATLSARLIDAQFPPYDQFVPKEVQQHVVRVPRATLVDAIEAVALASDEKFGSVVLDFGKKGTTVQACASESGDGSEEVPAELSGPPITVEVRASYLLNALEAVGGDTVTIDMSSDLAPVVMRAEGIVALAMPMRRADR